MMIPIHGETMKSASAERGDTTGDLLAEPRCQMVVFWAEKSRSIRCKLGIVPSRALINSRLRNIAEDTMTYVGSWGMSRLFGKGRMA